MSDHNDPPMTTGAWFLTLLVLGIPVLNLVMYIIWACGVGNRNRVTYCQAVILWFAIIVFIWFGLSTLSAAN